MKVDDCYQVGYVIKTHGLKGDIQIFLDVDDPSQYNEMESVFVNKNNTLVPFFIERIQLNGQKALVKFEEVDSIESATALVAAQLHLPLALLPELTEGQYFFHQLVGLKLFDGKKEIGLVDQVYQLTPQNLLSINHKGKEVLVPLNDEIVKKVDLNKKEILAELPDGLLDVFLDDDEN